MLFVLITILGLVVTPATEHAVVHSALGQFPIVGSQLTGPDGIHALKAGSVPGLIIGLLGLLWGARRLVRSGKAVGALTRAGVPGQYRKTRCPMTFPPPATAPPRPVRRKFG